MDTLTPEKRSWNMSRIRGKNTKPELAVRSMLHRMGYRFKIADKTLPGKPDIVLPRYRTVIFVHGCFWHRHPGCKYTYMPKSRIDFWSTKFEGNVMRDKNNLSLLEKAGWLPIVVWECEVKHNADAVLDRVSGIMQRRLKKLADV
ncbi:very short patch repair endonuclease [Candidatus Methylospira mobilis]|uniref:very short patch repair endonuclease n=1 Tax=Candidatus Methylospira mobilis TaxID=1808979 RepID=UPI0028E6E4A3|nr:very short patch repair endonuclease [Candidatus Methylospira mobilis]WNV03466.1 very short patch repair endonuclease [Candidatus Methylospira mobilis]